MKNKTEQETDNQDIWLSYKRKEKTQEEIEDERVDALRNSLRGVGIPIVIRRFEEAINAKLEEMNMKNKE